MSSVRKTTACAIDIGSLRFEPMQASDLAEVLLIEGDNYPYPWSRGNFLDSLKSGYQALVLRDSANTTLGYFLMMLAVDEAHLLNITVAASAQRQGIGRVMLDKAVLLARQHQMRSMLLEVRPSNRRALYVYQQYGFVQIGVRKNYYPAPGNTREDAIVMRLPL